MLVIVIFIIWPWKAANSYFVATMAKKEKKNTNTLKKVNVLFAIMKQKTRRVREIKLTTA